MSKQKQRDWADGLAETIVNGCGCPPVIAAVQVPNVAYTLRKVYLDGKADGTAAERQRAAVVRAAAKALADKVDATSECDHKRQSCEDIGCIGVEVRLVRRAILAAAAPEPAPPTGQTPPHDPHETCGSCHWAIPDAKPAGPGKVFCRILRPDDLDHQTGRTAARWKNAPALCDIGEYRRKEDTPHAD